MRWDVEETDEGKGVDIDEDKGVVTTGTGEAGRLVDGKEEG